MKALLTAVAAVVFATSAAAGTVNLSNYGHQDLTGFGTDFDDVYALNLSSNTWVSGLLTTGAQLGGLPGIDIQSVTLRRLGAGLDWTEILAINWDVADGGIEKWALTPVQLAAGQWQLEVKGVSYADKTGNGYSASVELPEPASVALAALALAGAGLASARRRKA
ncbi:FxDxF family PEP-CTERM protein [Roseateles sp.]|uniref:FxDxF family PEP-CTERM protein n=1 Tax=Roseateles sp. TaxID=1971397 RepID=UPI0032664249